MPPGKPPPKRSAAPATLNIKKKKTEEVEDVKGVFETKLAQLSKESAATSDQKFKNSRQHGAEERWPRNPVEEDARGIGEAPLIFQIVDLDYLMENASLIIRLFGLTKHGNSVCAKIRGYKPYFYCTAPPDFAKEHIQVAMGILNEKLKANNPGSVFGVPAETQKLVTDIEIVYGQNVYGYTPKNNISMFLKIFVVSPRTIPPCRNLLYTLGRVTGCAEAFDLKPFEANLDFEVRFMVDLDIVGCGWVELPANKYSYTFNTRKASLCQIEVELKTDDLIVHSPANPEWNGMAPLRTLSFDIECMGRRGIFPEASQDPIIQISNMVKIEGETEPFIRNCFVLGSCTPVIGSDIIECSTEAELLTKWADFFRQVDPDLITGYNIQNFDLPYIMDRAKVLKIDNKVGYLSRIKSNPCRIRDAALSSKQMGNRVNKMISMEGRIIFDVLQLILRDYKLRTYTLNSVSYHFLGEQKEDVEHNFIAELQCGSAKDRRRLAIYCMKDAYLPLRLLDKLMLVINYMEMARVTGVPLNLLMFRGQQVKIVSQLLRKTKQHNFFMPVMEVGGADNEGFEGATVIEPKKGYYQQPIATLDFASLYPSIMIAHNLCYTTLITNRSLIQNMQEGVDYTKTPSGDIFMNSSHQKGVLPQILEDLLSARKKAKFDLKNETDPFKKMVYNGRQLALKISANSVYGFTGASKGKMPCLQISQSVTAFGRQMIDMTKSVVEATYRKGTVEGKCPSDAVVIYGDTDSVMVNFGVETVAQAMELGQHAAKEVNKSFIRPIQLEFEKVYFPYLLINKKRYAGLYFTRPEKHDKMDCKGLETVRRDNCPLVANMMNVCLEKLMIERDKEGAVAYVKRMISDLLCNRVDISLLIITKELTRSGDKYQAKQAHVELAERMRKRDPGSAPRLGDRVPYVIVAKGKNVATYEKAEDPIFVLRNSVPIDTDYYLHHQLENPLTRIFDPVLDGKAASILFSGEHTRQKIVLQSKVGGLVGFTKKLPTCLGCKAVLHDIVKESDENGPKAPPPTCEHCKLNIGRIYADKVIQLRSFERRFGRLWTECQNCAGSLQDEVYCSSRDCPIFYMRQKVRSDLQEQNSIIQRFHDHDF